MPTANIIICQFSCCMVGLVCCLDFPKRLSGASVLVNLPKFLNMKSGLDVMHDANARAVSLLHKL